MRLLRGLIEAWALLGGVVMVAVVAFNAAAILGAQLGARGILGVPFGADVELTRMGIAIAVFAFLPYCQLTGGHVTADIFTARAGATTLRASALLAAAVAVATGALLTWRVALGLVDRQVYGYTTAIVQLPEWWAFVPILVSLALLVLAALINLAEAYGR